jgi:hypothetical protein
MQLHSYVFPIPSVMNCDARGRWLEDLWLICGELGLRATVPAGTVHVERLRERGARIAETLGTPAAGLRPRLAREKGFPSNLLLD